MNAHHERSKDPLVHRDRWPERAKGILIVSDVRLFREGMAALLELDARYRVAGHVAGSDMTPECLAATVPDLILLDMAIPNRATTIARIDRAALPTTILGIAVSAAEMESSPEEIGLARYVSEDCSIDELVAAMQSALRCDAASRGPVWPAPLPWPMVSGSASVRSDAPGLTGREREIVRLIDRCRSNKEIARTLGISPATVRNHVHNILEKLRVHRRAEAAAAYRDERC